MESEEDEDVDDVIDNVKELITGDHATGNVIGEGRVNVVIGDIALN